MLTLALVLYVPLALAALAWGIRRLSRGYLLCVPRAHVVRARDRDGELLFIAEGATPAEVNRTQARVQDLLGRTP